MRRNIINTKKGFFLSESMLMIPEIEHTLERWKSKGLSMYILLKFKLKKCGNGICSFDNITDVAIKMGVKKHTLVSMIKECELYHYDEKRGLFWCPSMRKAFHLSADPNEEELEDIATNGSEHVTHAQKNEKCESDSQVIRKSFASHSANQKSQSTDNHRSYGIDSKSKVISLVSKEIVSTTAGQKQVSACTADDADEKELREILSSKDWCDSIGKRTGINMTDNSTLNKFASWMFVYCRSKEKKVAGKREIRCYAANLLRPGSRTRAEFDSFLHRDTSGVPESAAVKKKEPVSEYEQVVGSRRYSAAGYHLPDWAPQQPSLDVSFSYSRGRWVLNEEFNKQEELKLLENWEHNAPENFKMKGGIAC